MKLIIPIFGGMFVGFFIVWITIIHMGLSANVVVFFLLYLMISFVFHLIIHECGHLIFGLFSGYQFSSIRFFSWGIRQNVGKLEFFRQRIAGTGGQCLMIPPQNKRFVYKLYLVGGGLLNFLVSILSLLIGGNSSNFLWAFSVMGISMAVLNLYPTGMNDGMAMKIARSSPEQEKLLYMQLQVNYLQSLGQTYQDLPADYYQRIAAIPTHTYFNDWQEFLIAARFLMQGDWQSYRQILEALWKREAQLILPYREAVKKELLFALCLTNPKDNRLLEFWQDKQVQQSLKLPLISNLRIRIAYTKKYLNDDIETQKLFEEAEKKQKWMENTGDYLSEIAVLAALSEQFKQEGEML